MARPLRIEAPGMWYHVMSRGNERRDLFRESNDCTKFLAALDENCARYSVEIHAYALMSNHFHLFLRTLEANLSRFMHRLLTGFTGWYNFTHERSGHLFQGRYKSIVVDRDDYGTVVSRYIHLNPVRTTAVRELPLRQRRRRLRQYKWSSYRAMIGLATCPGFLCMHETLTRFGRTKSERRRGYARFVEEGLLRDVASPFENVVGQSLLGSDTFVERMRGIVREYRGGDSDAAKSARELLSVPLDRVIKLVSEEYNISEELLRTPVLGRCGCEARRVAFWLAARRCAGGTSLREIGRRMGGAGTACVTLACQRLESMASGDANMRRRLARLDKLLNVYT